MRLGIKIWCRTGGGPRDCADQQVDRIWSGCRIAESTVSHGACTAAGLGPPFDGASLRCRCTLCWIIFGLVKVAKAAGVQTLYLHAFTDGRDTGPFTGFGFIQQVEAEFAQIGLGQIASVSGCHWAMDRDQRWDRVQRAR